MPLYHEGLLRVAAASPRVTVASPTKNLHAITELLAQAEATSCAVTVFPELCLTGYTCGDLFQQSSLQQAALDAEQAKRDAKQAAEDMRISKLIIASLVTDKVIKSDADFRSLILSDTDLVVNGKKQDDALHQKYKSQYLRSPDQIPSFSRNTGRRSQ